jgi:hypothetical protein
MKDIKLEVSQLKNYLGTGLKIAGGYPTDYELTPYMFDSCIFNQDKPIMYRLSDLDKFIPELGFVPLDKLPYGRKLVFYNAISSDIPIEITIQTEDWSQEIDLHDGFKIMSLLFEWNFWVFDQSYFEEGLILNKMKI